VTVDFHLPDLAEGVAEGELVAWRVAEGDRVAEDDVIAEVETDKALVEVPSPHAGVVTELCAAEGDIVPVGEVLVRFEVDEAGAGNAADATDESSSDDGAADDVGDGHADPDRPVPAPPSVRRLAREAGVDLATVEGSGPGGRVTREDVERVARRDAPGRETKRPGGSEESDPVDAPEEGGAGAEPGETDTAPGPTAVEARDRTLATPATRRVADELGIDLDRVPASEEREGEAYVTTADVRAYAKRGTERSEGPRDGGDTAADVRSSGSATTAEREAEPERRTTEATTAAVEAAAAALREDISGPDGPDHEAVGGPEERTTAAPPSAAGDVSGERVPYRGVRRTIGDRLARSARTVPHATHHDSVDVRRLVEVRESLNDATDVDLTYTAFVVRAVVSGLAAYPALNAQLDEEAEEIVYRDEYNIGVAVATEAGLMVPVVEDADEKGLEELAATVTDLAARARDRALAVEELRGGTFTVSNVGAIGGEYATPIVNHPEVAVLALGAIRERPRVIDGAVVPRPTLPLSLSIDHRVVDGAVAAAFTNHVMERLREPARLLL
jgi:pyruvate dehydrogenase E2 component (dihydrolipoamide acetyltransferase)